MRDRSRPPLGDGRVTRNATNVLKKLDRLANKDRMVHLLIRLGPRNRERQGTRPPQRRSHRRERHHPLAARGGAGSPWSNSKPLDNHVTKALHDPAPRSNARDAPSPARPCPARDYRSTAGRTSSSRDQLGRAAE